MIDNFKELSKYTWEKFGYVQCCGLPESFWNGSRDDHFQCQFPLGKAPIEFPMRQDTHGGSTKVYQLLLLLRYNEELRRYEILLNNHFPLRMSDASIWSTLLMPAYENKDIREFLFRIKMDMVSAADSQNMRSSIMGTEDKARRAEIDRKLRQLDTQAIHDIAKDPYDSEKKVFVKFSPTDGVSRQYTYQLTSLRRFAAKSNDVQDRSFYNILNNIGSVDAGQLNKGILRWEGNMSRNVPMLRRGVVWFPVEEWRKCPAIVARNADVMCWVEQYIENCRGDSHIIPGDHGYYDDRICLGKLDLDA